MFLRQITFSLLAAAAYLPAAMAQQPATESETPAVPPIIPATPIAPAPATPPAAPAAAAAESAAPTIQDPAGTPDLAKLPYKELIKIAQSDAKQAETAETYTLKISSKLGVPPGQIKLYLGKKEGPFPLEVDQNGFFQVPFSWQLMEENPLLVTNQPKGSLNLQVDLSLPEIDPPKVMDGKVKYRELFAPILELNESMRRVDPEFGKPDRQQFAIEITPGDGGTVKIQREYGSRTLKPDENGSVWLVFEKLLYEEKTDILMSEGAAVCVRPVTAEQALAIRAK